MIDPNDYEVLEKLLENLSWGFCRVSNTKTGHQHISKISLSCFDDLSREKIYDFFRELHIISMINHPSFLKFIGFSLTDFTNKNFPIVLSENASNYPLFQTLHPSKDRYELNICDKHILNWVNNFNSTKKLIIIYGIAAGMSYLHSNNILHRNLSTISVLLDKDYYPKIFGLEVATETLNREVVTEYKIVGSMYYVAPEVLTNLEYSKSSDVFSFSIILYEIMTGQLPYQKCYNLEIAEQIVYNKGRPEFETEIPECYKKLIEKCWSHDPKERPSFDEIVNELKTNKDFITEDVDNEEYQNYIKFIEESPKTFKSIEKFQQVDDLLRSKSLKFNLNDLHLEFRNSTNISEFKSNHFSQIYKEDLSKLLRHEVKYFSKMINLLFQINHPSIIKVVGSCHSDKSVVEIYSERYKSNLFNYLFMNEYESYKQDFDYTKKLCILYGIASGMAFLHSLNIVHRNLKPKIILLDEFQFPKIAGLELAKVINDNEIKENKTIKGTPAYISPEVFSHKGYSKASDVYSFSLIMFELLTEDKPFKFMGSPKEIKEFIVDQNKRPKFNFMTLKCHRELIEKCWSEDPSKRPTFNEIVHELKTNPDFIPDSVDKEAFWQYVQFIDEFLISFEPNKKIKEFDNILKFDLQSYPDLRPNLRLESVFDTNKINILTDEDYGSFVSLSYDCDIAKGSFYEIAKVHNRKHEPIKYDFIERKSLKDYHDFYKNEIINFSRELNILVQLNHPSILKFIDYNISFSRLAIFSNISTKGSLANLLELERNKKKTQLQSKANLLNVLPKHKNSQKLRLPKLSSSDDEDENIDGNSQSDKNKPIKDYFYLSDTKKLIIIYGIASGMAYLHSHNIIHRDLKPQNIYFDKSVYVNISGLNIAKEINENSIKENKTIKGSPAYIAPEVYLHKGYRKASDVYSFSLIMYELLTGELPFDFRMSPKEIKSFVVDEKQRPTFNIQISNYYQTLIEKCWSSDPQLRPTFDEIVNELKTNPDFINNKKYQKYIKFIDESQIIFNSSKKIQQLEEYVQYKLYNFKEKKAKINLRNIYETETNNVFLDHDFVNINIFNNEKTILREDKFKICALKNKQTGKEFTGQLFDDDINKVEDIVNELLYYNIDLYHLTFLNFIGYSFIDFKNELCPIILREGASNGTLQRMIEIEKRNRSEVIFTNTKKLICIYGIAVGMSYLHSQKIIHSNLNPSSIFLDDFLFPKIAILKQRNKKDENLFEMGKCDDVYESPEKNSCFASDVYAFGMIVYQIITEEKPYIQKGNFDKESFHKMLPKIKESTPNCIKDLILKCWSYDPKERPTFDQICCELKTNEDFIFDEINKEEYHNYIDFIDQTQNKTILTFEDFMKTKKQAFRKVKIDLNKLKDWKRLTFSVKLKSIDLSNFEKRKKIGSGGFGDVYIVNNNQTNDLYAAKVSKYEMDQCSEDVIINLIREIEIFSILDHPAVLKFIGYSSTNFKNKSKPVIISELAVNGSLDTILENERNGFGNYDWDDTKKLIVIYGIASGMEYLHRINIIHRDLKPANILLDEFLYPKIADFGLSKNILDQEIYNDGQKPNKDSNTSGFKGTYAYCAPEIFQNQEYSKYGDVYAFGLIVYEILTNRIVFQGLNQYQLMNLLFKSFTYDYLPDIEQYIPYCFKKLIKDCWEDISTSRPSFADIVNLLENDPSFITKNVNKEEYYNYIEYVKETQTNNERRDQTNSSLSNHKVNKRILTNSQKINETENEFFVDLNKFIRQKVLNKGGEFKVCQIYDKETGKIYAAQMSMIKTDKLSKEQIEKLTETITILSQIKHPSLLKFVGYSPIDFKKDNKPIIITELPSNGTLADILEIERNDRSISEWNNTKKLINMYGIALGMSYLHSFNIIHRSLNPSNIYLDDTLFPKIGDFGLSTQFFKNDMMSHQSISGTKGTPIYYAPETLQYNEYSKKSDVYSFAMIMYEIMINKKPFDEISNSNQIINEVVIKNRRPKFIKDIPLIYQNLIEKCWNADPNERPTFDEIAYSLKMDKRFIIDDICEDEFKKFIDFIDSQDIKAPNLKIDENIPVQRSNEISSDLELKNEEDQFAFIEKLINSNDAKQLIDFLNNKCDMETTSLIFDRCSNISNEFYLNLCKEGILINNPVANHKYAISLIFNKQRNDIKTVSLKEARTHLENSINQGFIPSYFLHARLCYEVFKENEIAFQSAKEGADKGDKYSKCLLGYFISKGIGTTKDLKTGVSIILNSGAEDYIDKFSNIIGMYYSIIEKNEKKSFYWFEKAFNLQKTNASINNYGICFMKGIGVEKDLNKAKEIFTIGSELNDANSFYHLAFLIEETDLDNSLELYKKAADQGHINAKYRYKSLMLQKNQNKF